MTFKDRPGTVKVRRSGSIGSHWGPDDDDPNGYWVKLKNGRWCHYYRVELDFLDERTGVQDNSTTTSQNNASAKLGRGRIDG